MSDQWLYRIGGHEFGPVSLELIRTLVASGTIAPDDEVRNMARSNWILACAAAELNGSHHVQESTPEIDRRTVRDEWYCRGYAGDYGPLKLSDLIQLAANGELQPDEEIKSRADDYWRKVSSVRRLVELLPFQDQPRKTTRIKDRSDREESVKSDEPVILQFPGVPSAEPSDNSLDASKHDELDCPNALDEITDPTETLTQLFRQIADENSESLPTTKPEDNAENSEHQTESLANPGELKLPTSSELWSGWIAGEEFGETDYTELLMWAVTGKLSPSDFVRRGELGQYVPAVSIPCLFSLRAAADSLSRRVHPTELKIADAPAESPVADY